MGLTGAQSPQVAFAEVKNLGNAGTDPSASEPKDTIIWESPTLEEADRISSSLAALRQLELLGGGRDGFEDRRDSFSLSLRVCEDIMVQDLAPGRWRLKATKGFNQLPSFEPQSITDDELFLHMIEHVLLTPKWGDSRERYRPLISSSLSFYSIWRYAARKLRDTAVSEVRLVILDPHRSPPTVFELAFDLEARRLDLTRLEEIRRERRYQNGRLAATPWTAESGPQRDGDEDSQTRHRYMPHDIGMALEYAGTSMEVMTTEDVEVAGVVSLADILPHLPPRLQALLLSYHSEEKIAEPEFHPRFAALGLHYSDFIPFLTQLNSLLGPRFTDRLGTQIFSVLPLDNYTRCKGLFDAQEQREKLIWSVPSGYGYEILSQGRKELVSLQQAREGDTTEESGAEDPFEIRNRR